MKTFGNSQAQGLLPMELPESTSSRAGSLAKTLALQDGKLGWAKVRDQDCGPRLSDLLASYDRNSSSWRTSQICLVALATNEADGLAEFSATWPSAGMMRNGKTYRRQPWALPIAESASGSWDGPQTDGTWPTPTKSERSGRQTPGSHLSLMKAVKGWKKDGSREMWPTPTRRDWKGGRKPETLAASGRGATNSLNDALTCQGEHGALNPTWVEWLMGFPTGHTDLQD